MAKLSTLWTLKAEPPSSWLASESPFKLRRTRGKVIGWRPPARPPCVIMQELQESSEAHSISACRCGCRALAAHNVHITGPLFRIQLTLHHSHAICVRPTSASEGGQKEKSASRNPPLSDQFSRTAARSCRVRCTSTQRLQTGCCCDSCECGKRTIRDVRQRQ